MKLARYKYSYLYVVHLLENTGLLCPHSLIHSFTLRIHASCIALEELQFFQSILTFIISIQFFQSKLMVIMSIWATTIRAMSSLVMADKDTPWGRGTPGLPAPQDELALLISVRALLEVL
jgi:hypothetical protein